MKFKYLQIVRSVLIILAIVLGSAANAADNAPSVPLKIGFVCVGPIADFGWNQAHNQARLALEKKFGNRIKTIVAEKVPENAECERVMERMIAQGNKLIFSTSYGYMEPMMRVAKRHPDVKFMQINRKLSANNVGTYGQLQYQPMYLAGMTAGRMTKTNKVGFVSAQPVPPLIQSINSFTLGARKVNPKVETKVVWTNSWSDQLLEAEAAKSLAESGVDVICAQGDNQTTVLKTCESMPMKVCGFYIDGHELAPKQWLTGANLYWASFYEQIVESVLNGTWKPLTYAPGIEIGCSRLSPFGASVPKAVRDEVLKQEALMKSGKFVVFEGPLKDREGKLRLAAGQKPDLKLLAEMTWFVDGVTGNQRSKK